MRRNPSKSPSRSALVSDSTCSAPVMRCISAVEHEANAAHGFEHPLGRVLPVLLVIVVNDAGRENDQRQRGSRDQKGETHWQ